MPAGESMKRRLERLVQPKGLGVRGSSAWYGLLGPKQYGPIYIAKPIPEEQPGPPLSQRSTGALLLAPLLLSRKI